MTDTQPKPDTAQQNTTPRSNGALTLREAVDDMTAGFERVKHQIAVALPPHISADRFQSAVTTAVNLQPDLLKADRRSLFNACTKAAQDGLLPDGREGALVVFNTKTKVGGKDVLVSKVTWMPMVYGIIKKARQSGEIATLGARIVYQNELETGRFKFSIVNGEDTLEHNPILFEERGAPVGAYARVKFKDGSIEYEVLNKAEIEKMRAVSRSKDSGPWVSWWEEMAKKSAIRRLAKRLPLSAELVATITREDEVSEYEQIKAAERARLIGSAAAQLSAPKDQPHDKTTGEIIEPGTEEPDDETEGDETGEFEESDPLGILADLQEELIMLSACVGTAAVDRLEKQVGATLVGKPDVLAAWSEACAARAAELMAKRK